MRLSHVDLPDTAFPHLTLVRQADVEEVLCSALQERGVQTDWGVEFRGLVPAEEGILRARLVSGERGPEEHLSRFLAGCDGQSSTVRGLIGATWRGAPYRVEAVLADVELSGPLDPGLLHVAVGRSGMAFLFALGEGATWRMLATRRAKPQPNAAFGQLGPRVPVEEVRRLIRESGIGAAVADVRWSARVPLQHRLAGSFGRSPIFLVGDAAHAHSPAGGQGMNNGILDAINLGWKLGLASSGDAHPELLDSYEVERRPAALQVLALTRIIFFGEASQHPAARLVRGSLLPHLAPILPLLLRRRRITAAAVRLLAQPFVRYPHSPISCHGSGGTAHWPRPGYRLPDEPAACEGRTTRLHELTATPGIHVLLEREASWQDTRAGIGTSPGRVHVHRLTSHRGTGILGVRPDGYVGFRGGDTDVGQLRDWLRLLGVTSV